MASVETHIDDSYFASGTHKRGDNVAVLVDPKADFVAWGVSVGMLIKNTTDGSEGAITAVTAQTITATLTGADIGGAITDENDSPILDENGNLLVDETLSAGNYWHYGDVYEIYLTGTEDSFISKIYTDRSRGWKVTKKSELNENGWFPKDADWDEDDKHAWGPGQPFRQRR